MASAAAAASRTLPALVLGYGEDVRQTLSLLCSLMVIVFHHSNRGPNYGNTEEWFGQKCKDGVRWGRLRSDMTTRIILTDFSMFCCNSFEYSKYCCMRSHLQLVLGQGPALRTMLLATAYSTGALGVWGHSSAGKRSR